MAQRLTMRTFPGPFFVPRSTHARARTTITHHDMNTGTQAISEICQRVSRSSISGSAVSFKVGEAPGPRAKNLPRNSHPFIHHSIIRRYQGPTKDCYGPQPCVLQ